MKRPRQHEIDDEAEAIFNSVLPSAWVKNPYAKGKDYAKDFTVEFAENGDMTGITFIAQVKGTGALTTRRNSPLISFPIETKHLAYWNDKVRDPVFLFVIDVHTKKGVWVFIQEHLRKDFKGESWRNKRKATVYLPATNAISDSARLRTEIVRARDFMAALHPLSIKAAVDGRREELMRRDPRFDISVSLIDGHPQYGLHAKEPVEFTFKFKGNPASIKEKVERLINRGERVRFEQGEIFAEGSPLLADIALKAVEMKWAGSISGTAVIRAVPAGKAGQSEVFTLAGESGLKEFRLQVGDPQRGLSVNLTGDTTSLHGQLRPNALAWVGKDILDLPSFELIIAIVDAIRTHGSLALDLMIPDKPPISLPFPVAELAKALSSDFATKLDLIARARVVSKHYNVKALCPAQVLKETAEDVNLLCGLATRGEYTLPELNGNWRIMAGVRGAEEMLKIVKGPGCFKIAHGQPQAFALFDATVMVPDLEIIVSNMELEDPESLRVAISAASGEDVEVRLKPVGESTTTYRLHQPEPGELMSG